MARRSGMYSRSREACLWNYERWGRTERINAWKQVGNRKRNRDLLTWKRGNKRWESLI